MWILDFLMQALVVLRVHLGVCLDRHAKTGNSARRIQRDISLPG